MNIHEIIDSALNSSPRTKVIGAGGLIIFIALILGFTFYLGAAKGQSWSDSKYLKDREARAQKILDLETRSKVHEENETQLKAQNEILKKANEAAAEVLQQSDAKLKGDANKLIELNNARVKKIEEINADNDFANQVRGICADYKASGFGELSFCAKFKEK